MYRNILVILTLFMSVFSEASELRCSDETSSYGVEEIEVNGKKELIISFLKEGLVTPKNFLIVSESGESYEIVSSYFDRYLNEKSLSSCKVLVLATEGLKGLRYDEDFNPYLENVFSKSGAYLLYFADELETEPENTHSIEWKYEFIKQDLVVILEILLNVELENIQLLLL